MKLKISIEKLGSLVVDLKERKKVLRAAATEVMQEARSLIRQSQGAGRAYYGSGGNKYKPYLKGRHQASAPGQPPATQTGFLANSLIARAFKSGGGFAVRDKAFYSASLERGAKGAGKRVLQPRPFLETALAKKWPSIERKIIDALQNGVTYKRDKKPR